MEENKINEEKNNRNHIRYPSSDSGLIFVVRISPTGDESMVPALMVDESYHGLGCVLIGPAPSSGERFWHQENEDIRTEMVIRHNKELDEDVQRLGFEITGKVART